MDAASKPTRIHYLDNLRALAMLLGVYLHAALAYAEPSRSIWIATNPQGSVAIDASIWWIHLFRMGLFFLLSGYFAKLVIQRKGLRPFLLNRGVRIALPFILFWPLLRVAMTIVFVFAFAYVKQPEGLLRVIVEASRNPATANASSNYTTMHLWFLYYLLMFSLLAVVLSRLTWLSVDWVFRRTWLVALLPLTLVPGVMGGGLPVASPESFVPSWWPFAWYGLFYWFGWQLYGREALLDQWNEWCWPLVLAGLLLFLPHYWRLPMLDVELIQQATQPKPLVSRVLDSVLAAYLSSIITVSVLLVGKRFLSSSSGWLKFCADSSYWVYLIHLPIILFLQTTLIPAELPVIAKLSLVSFVTLFVCFATYVVFVRYTPVGWMLHGKRPFP
jgi:peptidoglycan/LPS O-acetylase OafA/YrhL